MLDNITGFVSAGYPIARISNTLKLQGADGFLYNADVEVVGVLDAQRRVINPVCTHISQLKNEISLEDIAELALGTKHDEDLEGLAHELWALAQCGPLEGIEDAVDRIIEFLSTKGNMMEKNARIEKGKTPSLQSGERSTRVKSGQALAKGEHQKKDEKDLKIETEKQVTAWEN